MPRSRPPYAPEFREQIIELVRAGRTPEELAEEYEPSSQTIRNWVTQAERDGGLRADGPATRKKNFVDSDVRTRFCGRRRRS
jgi:transposase